jgi:hypothetical protein
MGLRDVFKNAADTIFTAVGDIPEDVYYHFVGDAKYDASSGTMDRVDYRLAVPMIFSNYTANEVNQEGVQPTDLKAMAQTSFFTKEPNANDFIKRIENYASVTYEVVQVKTDPVEAVWEFQLRKP